MALPEVLDEPGTGRLPAQQLMGQGAGGVTSQASRRHPPSSSPLDALRARGVDEPAASLTAETAVAVFRTAFDRWLSAEDVRDFPQHIADALDAVTP